MKLASVVAVALFCLDTNANAADARAVLAGLRQRIETTDSRGTGRLVQVDASGSRTTQAFTIKEHWFPGVLRILLEIVPTKASAEKLPQDGRVTILFEMRPNGQSTIRTFHPHAPAPVAVPYANWGESVLGTDFDYEDFLQPEFYWQDQTLAKTAKFGARDCDVLKSTAGAADRSHYVEVQTWVDRTIGYPVYVEKTLKGAGITKEFTSLGLTQSGGLWSAKQIGVKVHGRPGSTLLIVERGSTRANLTLKDFSPEQISRFEDHP